MTPEQEEKLDQLYDWMLAKKKQQLSTPLDEASKNEIGGVQAVGAGSTTTTQSYTDDNANTGGDTHTGPKAYAGSEVLLIDGVEREFPYIA